MQRLPDLLPPFLGKSATSVGVEVRYTVLRHPFYPRHCLRSYWNRSEGKDLWFGRGELEEIRGISPSLADFDPKVMVLDHCRMEQSAYCSVLRPGLVSQLDTGEMQHELTVCRVILVATMLIYARTGNEIYKRRRQLRNFSAPRSSHVGENLPMSSKTTEVRITSQSAEDTPNALPDDEGQSRESFQGSRDYQKYTVNIESTRKAPADRDITVAPNLGLSNSDKAAWAYTKCALLFFAALLITWVSPSSFLPLLNHQTGQSNLTVYRYLLPSTESTLSSTPGPTASP